MLTTCKWSNLLEGNPHGGVHLGIVLAYWLDETVPPLLSLFYLSGLPHLVLGQRVRSIVHVLAHKRAVVRPAERLRVDL